MKYIMFGRSAGEHLEQRTPIIFPNSLVHADVADALKGLPELTGCTVVSAGEFNALTGETYGGSTSLKVDSRPEDAVTIKGMDYFHGLEDV